MLQTENIYLFLFILPIVAFLYASVGHGGASGYLALMSLFSFSPETMKPTALMLNLFVSSISFIYYYKEGYFNSKLFFSFAITSIPLAFLGGTMEVDASLYKNILAVLLLFAILKMLNIFRTNTSTIKEVKIWQGIILGAIIGFFSGLIGIGGGIILTPIILLLHWGNMKEAAAVSALFIFVNSASGLTGQLASGTSIDSSSFILVAIAIIGAVFGSYYGSRKINNQRLKHILAFVLVIACIKLVFT
jgi:uncharacterized membrane protein YfcA